jgi:ZIP family zinc transporter
MPVQIIFYSAMAGICGTGLGGLVCSTLLKKSSDIITCWLLSFAAGVMTSIVCFGLVPEAFALSNIFVCLLGLILGIVVIMVLNRIVDTITAAKGDNLKIHQTHEELYHEKQLINDQTRMLRSGLLIFVAISLHNIPEGMAIGAAGSHDYRLGVLLAIMIALHNIPEGMAVAAPLLSGGVNKWKVVLLTSLSGAPTLLGGIAGQLIGNISDLAIAVSLSAAGGAMLYVVYGEMMPQTIVMTKSRTAPIMGLFGL